TKIRKRQRTQLGHRVLDGDFAVSDTLEQRPDAPRIHAEGILLNVPVYQLDEELWLPRPELADPSGIVAVGGDLRPERLLLAYANGIFPWYEEGLPILWHSPDPRWVIPLEELHVPRSVRKAKRRFEVRFDSAFRAVMEGCARTPRRDQTTT